MTVYTGGCQCGTVRFRMEGELTHSSICHCRMCQKASGGYYAPLVSVRGTELEWTRGERKRFKSSNFAFRGFCGDCGTPLTYEAPDGLAIAAGAFDDPAALPPTIQYGIEAKLPFTDRLYTLPGIRTEDDVEAADFINDIVSYQHPDHDTAAWPLEEKA